MDGYATCPGAEQSSEPSAGWGMTSQNTAGVDHWSPISFTSDSFRGSTRLSGVHFQTTVYEEIHSHCIERKHRFLGFMEGGICGYTYGSLDYFHLTREIG